MAKDTKGSCVSAARRCSGVHRRCLTLCRRVQVYSWSARESGKLRNEMHWSSGRIRHCSSSERWSCQSSRVSRHRFRSRMAKPEDCWRPSVCFLARWFRRSARRRMRLDHSRAMGVPRLYAVGALLRLLVKGRAKQRAKGALAQWGGGGWRVTSVAARSTLREGVVAQVSG